MNCATKIEVAMLLLLSMAVSSCADEVSDEMHRTRGQEVVYDSLNVYRLDMQQEEMSFEFNSSIKQSLWKKISYTRAVAELITKCNDKGDLGSGVLFGPNKIITADHVIRAWDPANPQGGGCPPTSALPANISMDVALARDRVNAPPNNNQYLDTRPPNLWLLRSRIHSLSMYESGDFDSSETYESLSNNFILSAPGVGVIHSFAGNPIPSNNKDVAILYASGVHAKEQKKTIFPGVFFDWAHLPVETGHYLDQSTKDEPVWGIHSNFDPSYNYQTQKTTPGDWRVDFQPAGPNIPTSFTRTPLLSESGYLRVDQSYLNEQCLNSSSYGAFCFGTTLDVLPGSSGGGVLYKNPGLSRISLVGVFQSGPAASINGVYTFTHPNELVLNDPPGQGNTTYATAITTSETTHPSTKQPDPKMSDKPRNTTSDPSMCIGANCNDTPEGVMVKFTCGEAFNETSNSSNSVLFDTGSEDMSGWKRSYVVGIVGAPTTGDSAIPLELSNIVGIGSMGVVCDTWPDKKSDRFYTDRWGTLKIVGLFRRDDGLIMTNPPGKVSDLMSVNQSIPLEFTEQNPQYAPHRNQPMPMKLCPPNSVMNGIDFIKSGEKIIGVHSISCVQSDESPGQQDFYLDPNKYNSVPSDANEFIQYIGNPVVGQQQIQTVSCGADEVLTGVHMFVHNNTSVRDESSLSGLYPECQPWQ